MERYSGNNGRFFFITWVPKILRTQSSQACMWYNWKNMRNFKTDKNLRTIYSLVRECLLKTAQFLTAHFKGNSWNFLFFHATKNEDLKRTNWKKNVIVSVIIQHKLIYTGLSKFHFDARAFLLKFLHVKHLGAHSCTRSFRNWTCLLASL